jgi:serine/threonine protein phosphatase 1
MNTFVIGDIHGAHKALVQCLQRSEFDAKHDRLIALGDVCDGYPDVKQCIDTLLKIKYCDYIIGNHDLWAREWGQKGIKEDIWLEQGGKNTVKSYGGKNMPQSHVDFLKNAHPYIEEDGRLFVHGGFIPGQPIAKQGLEVLTWDRELFYSAVEFSESNPEYRFEPYKEIFIGHTPTQKIGPMEPLHVCNVWALDTGAGWSGKLTIMNVETKQFWQSDPTPMLYPGEGRK